MHAVDALNEIGYWLERELASPYKTKAFRGAAAAIAGKPAEAIASKGIRVRFTCEVQHAAKT